MSDYEEKQRDAAQQWAFAKTELTRLDAVARAAAETRDKQQRHVQEVQEQLCEFVGPNQRRKLYSAGSKRVVIVEYRGGGVGQGPGRVTVELHDVV